MTVNNVLMVLIMLCPIGCRNIAAYNNMRFNQRNESLKEPQLTYIDCIERTNKPYEEYEREYNELLGQ